jgi:hypothetical protein
VVKEMKFFVTVSTAIYISQMALICFVSTLGRHCCIEDPISQSTFNRSELVNVLRLLLGSEVVVVNSARMQWQSLGIVKLSV